MMTNYDIYLVLKTHFGRLLKELECVYFYLIKMYLNSVQFCDDLNFSLYQIEVKF